jgi:hypothetical protein
VVELPPLVAPVLPAVPPVAGVPPVAAAPPESPELTPAPPLDELEADESALDSVVVLELAEVVEPDVDAGVTTDDGGTVKTGAPEVSVELPPPPQALRAAATSTAAPTAAGVRLTWSASRGRARDRAPARTSCRRSDLAGIADHSDCRNAGSRQPTEAPRPLGRRG